MCTQRLWIKVFYLFIILSGSFYFVFIAVTFFKKLKCCYMCSQLKTTSPKAPAVIPLQWLEVQASSLLHLMMQQCRTQYELRKLLQLLADMDSILKTNGRVLIMFRVQGNTRFHVHISPPHAFSRCSTLLVEPPSKTLDLACILGSSIQ